MYHPAIFSRFALLTVWLLLPAAVLATPQAAGSAGQRPVGDATSIFLREHCERCHAGAEPEGNFRLPAQSLSQSRHSDAALWVQVRNQLRHRTMPPVAEPQPEQLQREQVIAEVSQWLAERQAEQNRLQGRTVLRRLNRSEYVNTIRDLLEVDIELKDLFPESPAEPGFDNSAIEQHVSPYLMQNYLSAAERAIDAAIASRARPDVQQKRFDIRDERTIKRTGSVYRHLEDGVAIFSSWVSANIQVTLWQFQSRARGRYRFRISGYGFQTEKPVVFHVMAGPMNAAAQQDLVGYFDVAANNPEVVEFELSMEPAHTIRIIADQLGAIPPDVEKVGAENYQGPGLVIQWVDIQGPLLSDWPPSSHTRLFGSLPQQRLPGNPARFQVVSTQPLEDAADILRRFMKRAFRRPVTDAEAEECLGRVQDELSAGSDFEQAVRAGLKSVLMSPQFLFLQERPGKQDDTALAARLSYFLWSSMPDDQLLDLADQQKLHDPEILRQQTERLLNDPKARAFTENFTGQWLGLRAIDATMPDPMLYPEYDDILKTSSVLETKLFFETVLRENLSVTNFVKSDFAMLNGRLAQHYGIEGVQGMDFRKVPLSADSQRGGVLTMASVLKVTANGTTTSPILRGAWVLDRILGTPPPRPNVAVEAIEPDIRGATTIRQQLARHRDTAACAGCHRQIDPPGFALENFDVIGGWRERYRSLGDGEAAVVNGRRQRFRNGPIVESADQLADGRSFSGLNEFRNLLLEEPRQLARALAEKLVAYGTGAAAGEADQQELDRIVNRVADQSFGMRSLVHEVVQSAVFQHK